MDKSTSILIIFGAVLALIFLVPILGAVALIFIIPPVFIVAVNALSDVLSNYLSSNEWPNGGHFFYIIFDSAISYYIEKVPPYILKTKTRGSWGQWVSFRF